MAEFRLLPPSRPFHSVWRSWVTALALVFLAVAANVSFTTFARVGSEDRTRAAWLTYQPWKLSHGRAAGPEDEIRAPTLPGAWCARTATEGSTPWGRWSGELITCIRAQFPRQGPTAAAGRAETRNKEPSP